MKDGIRAFAKVVTHPSVRRMAAIAIAGVADFLAELVDEVYPEGSEWDDDDDDDEDAVADPGDPPTDDDGVEPPAWYKSLQAASEPVTA